MTLFGWTFEGQTSGVMASVALSDDFGDPVWSSANIAGFITYSNVQSAHGGISLLTNVTTAATAVQVSKTDTAAAAGAMSDYFYFTALPVGGTISIMGFRGGSTNLARVNMNVSGQLQIQVGATTGTFSSSSIPMNTWFRIEFTSTGNNSAATAAIAEIYALDDFTTQLFTIPTVTGVTTANLIDECRRSKFSGSATVTFYSDDQRQNIGSATQLGPALLAVSANDSATQSEGTTQLDWFTNVSDSATQTEQTTLVLVASDVSDSATQTEGSTLLAADSAVTDSATQGESTTLLDAASSVSDTATQGDSSSVFAGTDLTAVDSATQTESATVLAVSLAVSDTAAQTEGITSLAAASNVTDSATQTEGTTALTQNLSVSDVATQTDAVLTNLISSLVNDSAVQDDASLTNVSLSVFDSWVLSDVSTLQLPGGVVNKFVSDSATLTEHATIGSDDSLHWQFPDLNPTVDVWFPDINPTVQIQFP